MCVLKLKHNDVNDCVDRLKRKSLNALVSASDSIAHALSEENRGASYTF